MSDLSHTDRLACELTELSDRNRMLHICVPQSSTGVSAAGELLVNWCNWSLVNQYVQLSDSFLQSHLLPSALRSYTEFLLVLFVVNIP